MTKEERSIFITPKEAAFILIWIESALDHTLTNEAHYILLGDYGREEAKSLLHKINEVTKK